MTSYAYINDVIPHEEVTLTAWTTLGVLDVLVDEDIACISFVQGVGCVVCRQCNRPTGADEDARIALCTQCILKFGVVSHISREVDVRHLP